MRALTAPSSIHNDQACFVRKPMLGIRRREFILLVGGVAVSWPLAAGAQRPAMPVVGYLTSGAAPNANTLDAFRKGLGEMGFVAGRNVAFAIRTTEDFRELPALAADLVRQGVAVIYTGGTASATLAAKAATATVPIVFQIGADPVKAGLVASINRPGGNVTGVSNYSPVLEAKRLELLRELVPKAAVIGYLMNPISAFSELRTDELVAAARNVGQRIMVLRASSGDEIERAFAAAADRSIGALLVSGDGFMTTGAINSSRWRLDIKFQPAMRLVSRSNPAA
jgi:putative ABC transport system substrate-binding protein